MALSFGMPTLIENKDLEESVALCRELQLDFIELNMNLPCYQTEQLWDTGRFLELANKNDIYFTIHLDENLNVCDFNRAVTGAYRETVKQTIQIAQRMRIPVLNMHMNHGVHFTLPDRKVQLFEQYNEDYVRDIRNFREMCEEVVGDYDIKICIENTDGFRNYEREAVEYLLESKIFGLTWDIGHSQSAGNVDEGFIMAHEKELSHFHIHDASGSRDHMTLGTGQIDLGQRLEIAKRHSCRCVVETKTVEALRESVRWLRENGY